MLYIYRRNWLLSACAYSNGQQETMCLTASVHLIERTWALRAGPSTVCVTNVKDRHAMESVITKNVEMTLDLCFHAIYIP